MRALIVVDMQFDFIDPHGALPVPGALSIVEPINDMMATYSGLVIACADKHPRDHRSFKENGGVWPTHCVTGTIGAQFMIDLKHVNMIQFKGQRAGREEYSPFNVGLQFATYLAASGVKTVDIVGVALEYCVLSTAMDAHHAGFEVVVHTNKTRAVTSGDPKEPSDVLTVMQDEGIVVAY